MSEPIADLRTFKQSRWYRRLLWAGAAFGVFASWEELYVNFQLSSLFRLAWTFAETGLKPLFERPALSLEITGSFDPDQDRAAVARLKLEQHVKLLSAIQVSESEQRDLIKQRAQAVQSSILQRGKITADHLFIVTPKSGTSAKGQSRVNLSLN